MIAPGRVYSRDGSTAAPLAGALAWLWRLGRVRAEADASAIGFGGIDDAKELRSLVGEGRLRGAVILAGRDGPAAEGIPARRLVHGVASFGKGSRVTGGFGVFASGREAARSSLGVHAVLDAGVLALAVEPDAVWSHFGSYWAFPLLLRFLTSVLPDPLVLLPPVGWLRLDDIPGTAQHQLEGRDKSDRRQRRRVKALERCYRKTGAVLNVAVCAEALEDHRRVPLDQVWPGAVRALGDGVAAGGFEPVCHGLLHLDTDALVEDRVEYREYARLDQAEAGRRIDATVAWQERHLARPRTFVAPAWSYSDGALAAAAERGLPAWRPPVPGPLIEGNVVHETLEDGLDGIFRLDFGPLAALAGAGLPPTVVFHGFLLDLRRVQLRFPRDLTALARLFFRRDICRLPHLQGVRWVGTGEMAGLLRAHEQIEVRGQEVAAPEGAGGWIVDDAGRRPLDARAA